MNRVELTISVKREMRGRSPRILNMLADLPNVEVLGGEDGYALDVRVPARLADIVTSRVSATCDVEAATPLEYL